MKMKISRNRLFLVAGAVLVVAFLGWKIYEKTKGGEGSGLGGVAVAVEIAPIQKSSLRDLARFTGTLTAKSNVVVAPKIAGRLNRLLVDIGDPVRSGQLLAVLEDEEYRQQVIQAEADLRVAAANLEEARSSLAMADRNLERARTLHQTGIQSDAQLDQVLAQQQAQSARYNVTVAQLANREAALESSRVRLSYSQIKTSWDKGGTVRYVGERFADEGAMLTVNNPILTIIQLQPILAVIHVTDKDYFRLKIGQPAWISGSAFPGKGFQGRIVRIAPLLQEASRQARVEIEVENQEKLLKPGMFVTTQIEYARRADVTVVPYNALAKRNDRQGIFLVDRATKLARFIPVETGIVEGGRVEIVAPKNLSGYVVTLGHYLLEIEGQVIIPEAPAAAGDPPGESAVPGGDGR
ncbi:MAG TPA: efflux RND transporter periplasmic adaptor subunit [Patescibacteria group bacterium]|nr:efflux RND transporter periplasmic adaptor subunit [Patescibacteria group bacterium]